MAIDAPTATLIAAGAAAAISLVNLILTQWAGRRGEIRTQYRSLLEPDLVEFGEHLHQAVAMAKIVVERAAAEKPTTTYRTKGKESCDRLKKLRRKLKYPLWALDEPIRTLTRLDSWLGHRLAEPAKAKALVDQAEKLRLALDVAVRRAFIEGRPPNWHERLPSRWAAKRLRKLWEKGAPVRDESEDDAGE